MTSSEIENIKGAIRVRLRRDFVEVPAARGGSLKAHLEVWETKRGRRAIGVEFDHADRVNLWLTTLGMPRSLPDTISQADKEPRGRGWTDEKGDGANSNPSTYPQFASKSIVRLGVTKLEDATIVLDHLLA